MGVRQYVHTVEIRLANMKLRTAWDIKVTSDREPGKKSENKSLYNFGVPAKVEISFTSFFEKNKQKQKKII